MTHQMRITLYVITGDTEENGATSLETTQLEGIGGNRSRPRFSPGEMPSQRDVPSATLRWRLLTSDRRSNGESPSESGNRPHELQGPGVEKIVSGDRSKGRYLGFVTHF